MGKVEALIVTLCFLAIVLGLMVAAGNFAQHNQPLQALSCSLIAFVVVVVYALHVRIFEGSN